MAPHGGTVKSPHRATVNQERLSTHVSPWRDIKAREITAGLVSETKLICAYKCVSEECYDEVYGKDAVRLWGLRVKGSWGRG